MEATSKSRIVNICVFCGSNPGSQPEFYEAATELGKAIARRKLHLIYGGGNLGLMGAVSRAARAGGSQVLGIVPRTLAKDGLIGKTNGEELLVSGMSEQISEMLKLADAFIALPGGLGTINEILTIASWAHLNIHKKPIGLLDVENFFAFFYVFIEEGKRLGFMPKSAKDMFLTAKTPDELLDRFTTYEPSVDPILSKLDWYEDDQDRGKKRKLSLDLNIRFPFDD